jgi:hypothetical protein
MASRVNLKFVPQYPIASSVLEIDQWLAVWPFTHTFRLAITRPARIVAKRKSMSTEPKQNKPPNLVDEYKTVHDEIAMCQKEMHRTWLWATIAAGAIYTWLASHGSEINNLGFLRWPIWFVPPVLLSFCALRYLIFNQRITWLAQYLVRIETEVFGPDDNVPLPGVARYHQKCLNEIYKPRVKWPRWLGRPRPWEEILDSGQKFFWCVLIGISILASIWLAATKSEDTLSGHITDSSGHPMSAVTVSLDSNHAVTTDTNGFFHNLKR